MQTQKYELNFAGQNIFVGLDTHLKSWKVTIMHEKLMLKTFVQDPEPEKLVEYLKRNYPGATYHSAYEASYCGFWIHKKLLALGVNNIVVNPADIPTTDKEKKQKEDKRDSRKIARELQKGGLVGIYVPSDENLEDRALLRLRETMTGDLVRYKNRVKSTLHFYGIQIPEEFAKSSYWSKRFIKWLEDLQFKQGSGNQKKEILLNQVKSHRESLLKLTREIKKLSQTEKYKINVEVLLSVPGIGLINAMVLLTELDDITRFVDFDHLCAYVGVVPSTGSTGDKEIVRGITPRKNHSLRKMMVESSWMAIRVDPVLSLAYAKYRKQGHENKAIVKIARKLLSRIYYVLRTKNKYVSGVVK
jgi:transposase